MSNLAAIKSYWGFNKCISQAKPKYPAKIKLNNKPRGVNNVILGVWHEGVVDLVAQGATKLGSVFESRWNFNDQLTNWNLMPEKNEGFVLQGNLEIRMDQKGSGCSTAVAHMPRSKFLEVLGLILARCWTFFFFLYPS